MHPKDWWKYLLVVVVLGAAGVMYMGVKTYDDAPPIPDFKDESGRIIASRETILDGQDVFQKYALMQYGTMFGDGGARGPDFTADARRYANECSAEGVSENSKLSGYQLFAATV